MAATILNVDDDPANLHLRRRILTEAGFTVLEAADGTTALRTIREQRPNLVLLDVRLPDLSGFDLCRQVKEDPATADVYVLLISGEFSSDTDWTRGLAMGADGYVRTPIEAAPLVQSILALLRRQQAEARARGSWRAAEAELRASERRWRSLFDRAPFGVFHVNAAGQLILANDALVSMLQFPDVEALVRTPIQALLASPSADWPDACDAWSRGAERPREVLWRTREGHTRVLLLHGRRLPDTADTFEVFAQDLTALRRLEEEFRQAQKMEAIGQLAGGIAHDFNNLLTAILGYSELAIDQMPAESPLLPDLREIRQAAQRAGSLTQQLLAFSRRQVLQLQPTDLNRVVTGMEQMLRRLIGEHIEVSVHAAPELPSVNADPAQIEQVILNLALNARDAMAEGGRLVMTTERRLLEAGSLGGVPARGGEYVVLSVCDSGHGMDATTQSRIFEPFFTTKERGKGTGLGLSTVYGIVQQLSGYIAVESRPEAGTLFHLLFPVIEARSKREVEADARVEGTRRRGTILLVEDEDVLRRLARAVLARQGYTVVEASGPLEALQLSERQPDSIDLILADVLMPGMRGWEMVDRLRPQQPRSRVLYMSGYIDELETARDRVLPLISKPFKPSDLLERVREVLEN